MIKPLISMRDALSNPDIFGSEQMLGGPSWLPWRAIMLAAMGEELTDEERAIFTDLTGREREPGERCEELWGVVGRRGGKTRAIGCTAAYLAGCFDYRHLLAPGQTALVPVLAASKEQAQEAFGYIVGAFEASGTLRRLRMGLPTAESIRLKARVEIQVRAASFRRARGFMAVGAVCDELAFWLSDNSANPDKEVLDALRPSLHQTGGLLAVISSPYARKGELYKTYRRSYGPEGDPLILVVKAPTSRMNPTFPQAKIDRAYELDASAASAEYGAEFRVDVEDFLSREVIDAATDREVRERPPISGVRYFGFVDPSGGASDSFTLGISHAEGDLIYLDALRERRPPFSPDDVTRDYADLLKRYGVSSVCGDRYAGEYPRERFRSYGITYTANAQPKSDIYRDTLPLMNSGRVRLLDHPRLAAQLLGLERRTSRGGRDSIDHGPNAHDDVANAAAGAIIHASAMQPSQTAAVVDSGFY